MEQGLRCIDIAIFFKFNYLNGKYITRGLIDRFIDRAVGPLAYLVTKMRDVLETSNLYRI